MKQIYITLLLVVLLCGCTRRVSTAIERVRTDTFILVQRDTVSIINEVKELVERVSHDTVRLTERITYWVDVSDSTTIRTDTEREHYVSKAQEANMSVEARYDTLVRQYQKLKEKLSEKKGVVVEVEKPIYGWKQIVLTRFSPIILLLAVLGIIYFYIYKKRK
jgi:hypothetical protein